MTTDISAVRVLRCRSGALEWAVADASLCEVAPWSPVTRIPGAAAGVLGLANLRGELLVVLDGRALLGQPADQPPCALLVVEAGGRRLAVAVDAVDDLHHVPLEAFSLAAPEPGVPAAMVISRGVADRPFLLVDVDALAEPALPARAGPA